MATKTERHSGVQDEPDKDGEVIASGSVQLGSNQPPSPAKEKKAGRVFMTRRHFGPFHGTHDKPHIFTEDELRRLSPIPNNAIKSGQIDPDTYHDEIIASRLALGIIEIAPGHKPMPTPPGPENHYGAGAANFGIKESTESILASRAAAKTVYQTDLVAAKEAQNDKTPAGPEIVRNLGIPHPMTAAAPNAVAPSADKPA